MPTRGEFSRSFAAPLEIRSAGQGGDGRTVHGICVPFGQAMRIDHTLVEQFRSGCCDHQIRSAHRIRLREEHTHLIGGCIELRNDAAGLYGAFRVAKTQRGDEVLALIEAGAYTDLSVGFRERQNRRLDDGIIERVTVDLREVSVVEAGAYAEHAAISGVRSAAEDEPDDEQTEESRERLARARGLVAARLPLLPLEPPPFQRADSDGSNLKQYWTKGPGLAKWAKSPHPWTALYNHLKKHMPAAKAKRVASQWFHDVFGIWPGEREGKNPAGKG